MMNSFSSQHLLLCAIQAALHAGEAIRNVYNTEFAVTHKEDKSPLTLADKHAHEIILKTLLVTGIPVLSEEGKAISYDTRKLWSRLWIVDPLDGTKEFIKRNGEFTVNIALVEKQIPVMGVIYVPVRDTLYFSSPAGAFRKTAASTFPVWKISEQLFDALLRASEKLPLEKNKDKEDFVVVASRSHLSPETETFVANLKLKHPRISFLSAGSSLKICLVAEGAADVYPRLAPTMEWDTAAGQAIAEAAGKNVRRYPSGDRLLYNRENLLNDFFVVD